MNKTRLFILGAFVVAAVLIGLVAVNEMPSKQVIATEDAPGAIGPYSQGILVGDTLYCSGQIPLDPATGELVSGTMEAQTRQVLDNLGAVLRAAGMDYGDVVSVTIFMDDMDNFASVNQVYAEYFTVDEQPPARCTVEAARLPKDARVEISLIAIKTR